MGCRPHLPKSFGTLTGDSPVAASPSEPTPQPAAGTPVDVADLPMTYHLGPARVTDLRPPQPVTVQDLRIPDYEILGVLGKGGMGIVYKARHVTLNRLVALKVILGGAHADSQQRQRFRTEAEAAARLQHVGIVQVYDIGEYVGIPHLSLEYVAGGTLANRLAARPLPATVAAEVTLQLAAAMAYAHGHGVIHRDLKPENILLAQPAEEPASGSVPPAARSHPQQATTAIGTPKIADFGLAKCLDQDQQRTVTGVLLGTPAYMAPEQAMGRPGSVGPAADIYALGAILYEMLTGRPPFCGHTPVETMEQVQHREPVAPSQLQPRVPRDLETICLHCLQKEPRKRYAAASDLVDDLTRFLAGEPIQARRLSAAERGYRWCRRHPGIAALWALVLVTLLAGTLTSWYFALEARDRAAFEQQARAAADEARRQAEARLVRLKIATGAHALDARQPWTALLWFHQAWNLDPAAADRHADPMDEECHRLRLGCLLQQLPQLDGIAFHDSIVSDAWFLPDDRRILTLDEHAAHVWDPAGFQRLFTLAHPGAVSAVAFDTEGRWLATAGSDGARLWHAANGTALGKPLEHPSAVVSLAFQPKGELLATGDSAGTLRWWRVPDGELVGTATLRGGLIETVTFSPDGKLLAAWCGRSRVWLVPAGAARAVNSAAIPHVVLRDTFAEALYPPVFTPDGRALCTLTGKDIALYKVADGSLLGKVMKPGVGSAFLTLAPDGTKLACNFGQTVAVMPLTAEVKPAEVLSLVHPRESHHGAWHPSGRFFASSASSGEVYVRDLNDRSLTPRWNARQGGAINRLAFSADGTRLLAVSRDGAVRVWKTDSAPPPPAPHDFSCGRAHLTEAYAAGKLSALQLPSLLSADGRLELRRWHDPSTRLARVQLVERTTGQPVTPSLPAELRVDLAAFARGGAALFTSTPDGCLVWDLPTGKPRGPSMPGLPGARRAALSDDGERVVMVAPSTALAYETRSGRILMEGLTPTVVDAKATAGDPRRSALSSADIARDGRRAALCGAHDWGVFVIDLDSGRRINPQARHLAFVSGVEFSADGRRVAAGGSDTTARIWDSATGEPVGPALRHPLFVRAIALSPDGRLVATYDSSSALRVWDGVTGDLLMPARPVAKLRRMWFSEDGRSVVCNFADSSVGRLSLPRFSLTKAEAELLLPFLAAQSIDAADGITPIDETEIQRRHAELQDLMRRWRP